MAAAHNQDVQTMSQLHLKTPHHHVPSFANPLLYVLKHTETWFKNSRTQSKKGKLVPTLTQQFAFKKL